jgi:hypothetical protein
MPAGHVGWGSPRKIEQSEDDLVAAGQRALATLVPPTIGAAPQYVPQTRGNFGLPLPHDEDPE